MAASFIRWGFIVMAAVAAWLAPAHAQTARDVPQFRYDPSWPKPLPQGWGLGAVGKIGRAHV